MSGLLLVVPKHVKAPRRRQAVTGPKVQSYGKYNILRPIWPTQGPAF
jgi:hypothetical protein